MENSINYFKDCLVEGLPLITKNPEFLTNGVIYKIRNDGMYVVVSDFGNKLFFNLIELDTNYKLPNVFIEYIYLNYITPCTKSDFIDCIEWVYSTVENRLETQLNLLNKLLLEQKFS